MVPCLGVDGACGEDDEAGRYVVWGLISISILESLVIGTIDDVWPFWPSIGAVWLE